jgi:hypothetical protein
VADLFAQVLERNGLSLKDRITMYGLYNQYYGGCDFNLFSQDLQEKDFVILLRNSSGKICGFTTLMIIEFRHNGVEKIALFSGDTIIHRDYWGSQALSLSWCRLAGIIKAQHPDTPLYWFLIVKGYRTYRYLPLFAKIFYPTWRSRTPQDIQEMMDLLATRKFGDAYIRSKGIIQFENSHGHLNGDWADIPDRVSAHPDVQFFLEKNPGYTNGDELVCLTELTENNLRSYALRAFKEAVAS